MKPIKFDRCNVTFARDQKQYLPLPAYKDEEGRVTSCWKLSLYERVRLLFWNKLYIDTLTFNDPLQPIRPSTKFIEAEREED